MGTPLHNASSNFPSITGFWLTRIAVISFFGRSANVGKANNAQNILNNGSFNMVVFSFNS
jgi:hypothetical protein